METMTVDEVIERLQKIKASLDGNAPVALAFEGGERSVESLTVRDFGREGRFVVIND